MKTKTISFSFGKTISDNNYGSTRLDMTETIEIEDGDNIEIEEHNLRTRVFIRFQAQLNALNVV